MSARRLPRDPVDRAATLVSNSLPGARALLPAALPPEAAELILEARKVRAVTYSSMEDLTDRCRRVAEEMDQLGVVMHLVDDADAESLVHHIDQATKTVDEGTAAFPNGKFH